MLWYLINFCFKFRLFAIFWSFRCSVQWLCYVFLMYILVMFFSLDRPVTKNQWLSTKCQPKMLLLFLFQNRKDQVVHIFFQKRNDNRNFGWHLVKIFMAPLEVSKKHQNLKIGIFHTLFCLGMLGKSTRNFFEIFIIMEIKNLTK